MLDKNVYIIKSDVSSFISLCNFHKKPAYQLEIYYGEFGFGSS